MLIPSAVPTKLSRSLFFDTRTLCQGHGGGFRQRGRPLVWPGAGAFEWGRPQEAAAGAFAGVAEKTVRESWGGRKALVTHRSRVHVHNRLGLDWGGHEGLRSR